MPTVMRNSSETTSSKCFSAILSRLLCSGGLPTHPSEQLVESSTTKLKNTPEVCPDENSRRGSTPGVVARLMGLDSFPSPPPKAGAERTLGDFFRSRSVNSIDFLSHFDPVKNGGRRHRRVRTSVSFREHEYASVVLLFEEELQGKMEKEKSRKDIGIEEKRKSFYGKKMEVSRKLCGGGGFEKKEMEGEKRANLKERRRPVKKMKKKKKCEEEMVRKRKKKNKSLDHKLDCDSRKMHNGIIKPEVARGRSPRKHQPSQNAKTKCQSSCPNVDAYDNMEAIQIIAGKNERKMSINEDCYYTKRVEEICMLNEDDLRENWNNYGMEVKFENFEDLCQIFGQGILEELLRQFVDDLVLNYY